MRPNHLLIVLAALAAIGLLALCLTPAFAGVTIDVDAAGDWPKFHHDLSNTGYSTSTAPNTNRVLWSYTTGNAVYSSPAVADGKVYVGSVDSVYCLDAATGARQWDYSTGGWVGSSPAVADGKVYVGSGDGKVYCLDAATGARQWDYSTGDLVLSSPAVANGKVYVGSHDGEVYCLDAATGLRRWWYSTGGYVELSPAVADGKVYVGSWDGKVYCMDAATGARQWDYSTGGWVRSSPAVADGKVYVGSDDAKVYCLDAATGAWQWEYQTGDVVVSSPAVANGKVYVGSYDNKVYCLDAATGAWQWEYSTGDRVRPSPAVADGKVYVGSWDGKVYCLDADTGAPQWEYSTGDRVSSSAAVADGKVYVGSYDRKVYCFADNEPPTADFEWDPASPTTLAQILFTDSSSDPDGTVVAWWWDFGDGYTEPGRFQAHTYTSGGCMEVTLTVTDSDGATDTCSKCVPVRSDTEVPFCDAGWHMVAQPHSGDHALTDATVRDDLNDVALPFCDAAGAGWVQSPLFSYNTKGQRYESCGCADIPPPTADHTLRMGFGYWFYTFEPYLTLVFP